MNPMQNNPNIPVGSPAAFAGNVPGMVQQPPPGMMSGPGPVMAPVPNNPPPGMVPAPISGPPPPPPPSSGSGSNTSPHDLIRLKRLVTMLRETLRNFFTISALNLEYNIQLEYMGKNLEQPPKLEKSLEDVLALCNQIELCLRTILECSIQLRDSRNYLQFQVSTECHSDPQAAMTQPNIIGNEKNKSYAQYVTVIKKQVSYAKSIYDTMLESVKQIKHTEPVPPHPPPPSSSSMSQIPGNVGHMPIQQGQPPPPPPMALQPQQPPPSVLPSQHQSGPGTPAMPMSGHAMHQ